MPPKPILPNSPSLTISIPASACLRSTSAMPAPSSLPACVVRMRPCCASLKRDGCFSGRAVVDQLDRLGLAPVIKEDQARLRKRALSFRQRRPLNALFPPSRYGDGNMDDRRQRVGLANRSPPSTGHARGALLRF